MFAACLSLSGAGILLAQTTAADFDRVGAAAAEARARGDAEEAAGLYAQALALRPDWQEGWWFLGVLNYGADRYAPAIEAFDRYLALNPSGGPALALRGLCEFEAGRYPESLQDLQRAIALGAADNPRNGTIVRYHEALLLTRLGRFEEAIGRYAAMVKKGEASGDLATGVGLAGLRMALLPSEVEPAEAALVAAAGSAGMQVFSGDAAGGDAAFAEIFRRFPTAPNVHYFYGYLLLSADPVRAVAEFEREAAVSPRSANAHAMLAWATGMEGDFAASLPNAKLAAAEDPSLALGQLVLGKALVETGDASGGAVHLETLLRTEPSNLEGHLALAKAYSNLGRAEEARRERLICLQLAGLGSENRGAANRGTESRGAGADASR
jgi:tetratricopeptide (TPR) repeat protein